MPGERAIYGLAACAILAGALGLRLHGAAGQSLWYDEGTSVALAASSPLQIAASSARDIHPPLYYLLLAGWTRATGTEIVALRGLSALIGVVVVAGVIGLGTFLWRRAAGLAAGVAAAASPYLVWYSQEIRSYILVAALVTILVYLAVASTRRSRGAGWWITIAGVTCAALYTHYFCGLAAVLAANAAFVIGALHTRNMVRTAIPRWTATQVAALLAFLPWLWYARESILAWPATSGPMAPATIAKEAAVLLAGGAGPRLEALAALLAVWSIIGVVAFSRGLTGVTTGAIPLAIAASGPAGLIALSLTRPAWNAKFLVSSAPGLEIMVGAGLAAPALWLAHRRPGRLGAVVAVALFTVCAATVAVPRIWALEALAHDPAYARDDYRGLAAFVDSVATDGDAIILNAPTQVEVYGYYDTGAIAVYPLPESRPPEREPTLKALGDIGARHGDIFAILWATSESDPEGLVERWLNESRAKAYDRWFGTVRLARYGNVSGLRDTGISARFGEAIDLVRLAAAGPTIHATAGDVIALEAVWQPLLTIDTDYVVFAQLLDSAGQLVAGRDLAPVGGSAQTSGWDEATGDIVDRIGLALPTDLSAGTYTLILGLYDPATGGRLAVNRHDPAPEAGNDRPSAPPTDYLEVAEVVVSRR